MPSIKLTSLLETSKANTAHGDLSGPSSVRRFTLDPKKSKSLLKSSFKTSAQRFLLSGHPNLLFRLAHPRISGPGRKEAEVELVVPSKMERTSKDASNLYTVLLSNLPSWKGWPRRSYSVIFFVGKPSRVEGLYGTHLYKILPKNNAKIVVAPIQDLLTSGAFPHLTALLPDFYSGDNIESFNTLLSSIISVSVKANVLGKKDPAVAFHDSRKMNDWIYSLRNADYKKFIQLLEVALSEKSRKTIPDYLTYCRKHPDLTGESDLTLRRIEEMILIMERISKLAKTHGGVEGFLSEILDPEKNGFKLTTVEKISSDPIGAFEGWTEDPCIMINTGPVEDEDINVY